jgi:hypothetical protein
VYSDNDSFGLLIILAAVSVVGTLWLRGKLGNVPKKEVAPCNRENISNLWLVSLSLTRVSDFYTWADRDRQNCAVCEEI